MAIKGNNMLSRLINCINVNVTHFNIKPDEDANIKYAFQQDQYMFLHEALVEYLHNKGQYDELAPRKRDTVSGVYQVDLIKRYSFRCISGSLNKEIQFLVYIR